MAPQTKSGGALSNGELAAFCAQIAMIMKSGISVHEGIGIMCEDMQNPQGREVLEAIREKLNTGGTFFSALELTGKFPKYMVDMTQIGETTGKLDDVMDSLCAYYEREESIAKSIKNAVTYPLIMIVMMVLVISVLLIKVMPLFNEVFVQLGSEMTGFSHAVMNFGAALGRYSFVILGVVIALIIAYFIMRATRGGKKLLQKLNASFFITKKLNEKIASGRFASAMALMLSSGLDTDESLEMVYKLVDNDYIREKITSCKVYISDGEPFAESLVKAGIFSGIYARMVTVAFKTGAVDSVMEKLAGRYEEEIDTQIGNFISIMEPTLVAALSIIVGMILLSVMMPLMGIMSSIG